MATFSAVWIPDASISIGSALVGPGGDSGNILLGKYRLFRVWSDNTAGMSISFGLGSAPLPTSSSYAINDTPQDFDMGPSLDTIRLVNNSGISSSHYYLQVLARV